MGLTGALHVELKDYPDLKKGVRGRNIAILSLLARSVNYFFINQNFL